MKKNKTTKAKQDGVPLITANLIGIIFAHDFHNVRVQVIQPLLKQVLLKLFDIHGGIDQQGLDHEHIVALIYP